MNKKKLIILISSVIAVLIIIGVIVIIITGKASAVETNAGSSSNQNDYTYIAPSIGADSEISATPTLEPFVPATEMDLEPTSITVFVNKEHALPKSYRPAELVIPNIYFDITYYDERTMMRPEAARAIEFLFAAAQKDGYKLCGVSGFRSYDRQYRIFINNIVTKGKDHTLKYSAVPGTSEHQTGLVMDISSQALHYDLSAEFADTPEGKWVAEHAHLYGFIIRYPEGKADITGYAYEPWHIRYVGRDLATYLYKNDLSLDEYYHYTPSANFNFEATYASLINYAPTITVSVAPLDGDGVILGENGEIIDGELGTEVDPLDGEMDGDELSGDDTTKTPTPAPEPTAAVDSSEGDNTDNDGDTTGDPDSENNNGQENLTPTVAVNATASITPALP